MSDPSDLSDPSELEHFCNQMLVEMMNKLINEDDPRGRIKLAYMLAMGFGRVVAMPGPILEQLVTKLEQERQLNPESDAGGDLANTTLTVLRIVLDRKTELVEDFKKRGLRIP